MKEIKSKSAGVVFLLEKDELPVEGKICFTAEELSWARDCGKDFSDAEKEKDFWQGIIERKREDHTWVVFTDFPRRDISLAQRYCEAIKNQLRGRGARTRLEKQKEEEEGIA